MGDEQRNPQKSSLEEAPTLKATHGRQEPLPLEKTTVNEHEESSAVINSRLLDFAFFAVENHSDAIYLISKDGRIAYVNTAACRMLGYRKSEMIGMSILKVDPTLTKEIWDAVWLITERDKQQTIESEHITKDGHFIPVEIVANHLAFDGMQYSCSFTRDISERLRLEKRLRHSEKMEAIGQLAGGVAHDFNNQLAGIVGYADILREELAGNPELARLAEAILAAAKRSASLTEQLLAFSRQGKYLSTPVDLNKVIEEIEHMLKRSIDKRIAVKTSLSPETAVTIGDPSQIQNAVLNLAINARDAMPDGGDMMLSTRVVSLDETYCANSLYPLIPGPYIEVIVADTGTGMDAQIESRMFDPFFTTKETGRGTGMGLAAVYGTVKNHKGAIEVHTALNRGTQILLYFSRATALERAVSGISVSLQAPEVTARVLLVEDEETLRDMTVRMLTRLGCRTVTAKDGKEAVAIYRELHQNIDVVILDLVMPEMSGRETFFQLRDINPQVVVLLASGYSFDGEVQALMNEGAKGFLQKPYRTAELARKISEILDSRKTAS
jgi:PAS domain S-box-containing protein